MSSDATIKKLKNAAKKSSLGKKDEKKMQSLSKAFESFSIETMHLYKAYSLLKKQFNSLNIELEDANRKLQNKNFEVHVMVNYLSNLLNNITQGIIFVGLDGIITTFNPAAAKILHLESHEVLFNSYWDYFPDDFFGFSMKDSLKSKDAPERAFVKYMSTEGSEGELEVYVSFVKENAPKDSEYDFSKGIILLIRDITKIRQLQQIASRNDRMKELGEMAAMVAHEIRNPLGGIKGFASLLARDLKDDQTLQAMAQYIVEGTDNLNNFVTSVLNYARPVQTKFETTDLVSLINEIRLHIMMDQKLTSNIQIFFETELKALSIPVDVQLFKSAVLNLIVNAIQAMSKGGVVTLTLNVSNSEAIIEVIDKGTGISEENLEKIFSPFFTTKPEGHGFGLAEVNKNIHAHLGHIEVDSKVGFGTTFTIKLPLDLMRKYVN